MLAGSLGWRGVYIGWNVQKHTHVLCFILEAHRTMLARKRLLSSARCGWKRQDQHLFVPVKEAARRYEVPEWALSAACEQGQRWEWSLEQPHHNHAGNSCMMLLDHFWPVLWTKSIANWFHPNKFQKSVCFKTGHLTPYFSIFLPWNCPFLPRFLSSVNACNLYFTCPFFQACSHGEL